MDLSVSFLSINGLSKKGNLKEYFQRKHKRKLASILDSVLRKSENKSYFSADVRELVIYFKSLGVDISTNRYECVLQAALYDASILELLLADIKDWLPLCDIFCRILLNGSLWNGERDWLKSICYFVRDTRFPRDTFQRLSLLPDIGKNQWKIRHNGEPFYGCNEGKLKASLEIIKAAKDGQDIDLSFLHGRFLLCAACQLEFKTVLSLLQKQKILQIKFEDLARSNLENYRFDKYGNGGVLAWVINIANKGNFAEIDPTTGLMDRLFDWINRHGDNYDILKCLEACLKNPRLNLDHYKNRLEYDRYTHGYDFDFALCHCPYLLYCWSRAFEKRISGEPWSSGSIQRSPSELYRINIAFGKLGYGFESVKEEVFARYLLLGEMLVTDVVVEIMRRLLC